MRAAFKHRLTSLSRMVDGLADRAVPGQESSRRQRVIMGVAAVLFIGGAVAGGIHLHLGQRHLRWWALAVAALIGAPLTILVNAVEFAFACRLGGRRVARSQALRVSLLGSAANLLPLPGAALVRLQTMRRLGIPARAATALLVFIVAVWVAVSGVVAGVGLAFSRGWWSLLLIGAGLSLLLVAGVAFRPRVTLRMPLVMAMAGAVLVEALSVVIAALRLCLVLVALGQRFSAPAGMVLALSGAIASLAGIFPGGLGLREAVAAGLSPLVGISPALGFLASAVSVVTGSLVSGVLTLPMLRGRRPSRLALPDEAGSGAT